MSAIETLLGTGRDGPALTCGAVDPRTGTIWVGSRRGAFAIDPGRGLVRRLKLGGEPIHAIAATPRGVWLAGRDHLVRVLDSGSGVAKTPWSPSLSGGVRRLGMAATSEALWVAVSPRPEQGYSLLRHELRRRVSSGYRLDGREGPGGALAICRDPDGVRILTEGWLVRIDDSDDRPDRWDSIAGNALSLGSLDPSIPDQPGRTPASLAGTGSGDPISTLVRGQFLGTSHGRLLGRFHGRSFQTGGGSDGLNALVLPEGLHLLATSVAPASPCPDREGAPESLLVGTGFGCFLVSDRSARCLMRCQEVVTVLAATRPLVVTGDAVYRLTDVALISPHEWPVDRESLLGTLVARRLDDADPLFRSAALDALASVPDGLRHRRRVVELLTDPDPAVRVAASGAAATLLIDEAWDTLTCLVTDPSLAVQRAALDSLRVLRDIRLREEARRRCTA